MKINAIPLRTSLGLTVIIMGLFTIALVFFSGETYRELAIENQRAALVDLVGIKVDDLLAELEDNAAELGLGIQYDKHFRKAHRNKDWNRIRDLLDDQFTQYFVTADILKLEKLQVLDQNFSLVSESSTGGLPSNQVGNCPGASSMPTSRTGFNRLKPFSKLCVDGDTPYLSVTVPIGLRPDGYIRVVTDPIHDLRRMETELGMPLQLSLINGDTRFISSSWNIPNAETSSLVVDYPLVSDTNQHVVTASLLVDVHAFFEELKHTRNMVMFVVGITTLLTVLLVRLLSEKLILKPLQSLCTLLRRPDRETHDLESRANHGVISEFAELRELYNVLEDMAMTDPMTGLANRAQFEQRLQSINSKKENKDVQHAVCFMDLDRFKIINDTCGHAAGDSLLQQIGQLFKDNIRNKDLVARIGGDEFAILLENCPASRAENIAETLRKTIENYHFFWDSQLFSVGVSIGVVPFTPGSRRLSDIMSMADAACYTAKENGRNRVHLFHPDDTELTRHRSNMRWATRITQALGNDQFELFYQPIAMASDRNDTCRFQEISLMMNNEDGNRVSPGEFIPVAEKYDLMVEIDKWVIQKLCTETDRIIESGRKELPVFSIRLSGQSLADENFLNFVLATLDDTKLPKERICFEITEAAAIANLSKTTRFVSTLKNMGIQFLLDDFGSGLSSFNYLKSLKVDFVKINGSFVLGMDTNEVDFNMVRAINQMAKTMGMKTIAETVENEGTWKKLQDIGVDYIQGSYIGRPAPLTELYSEPTLAAESNVILLHKN